MLSHASAPRPSNLDLLNVVSCHKDGMSALDLLNHFLALGHSERDVQRTIQRALNANVLEIGSKLRLFPGDK